ncbi:MAG TPA: SIS domain-containing protein, partial [Lentimicrobium sp.]|nr:SIS domain-containing protein [Lentimicrobium sp.]
MQTRIREVFRSSIDVKELILQDENLLKSIEAATRAIINAFRMSGSVLFCGNGGSAADAQHLAAEFSGRFYYDRPPLNSEALHVNTSYLTAVGNDYSFDEVYARIVRAKGKKGDVLVALSTSGNSENILRAIQAAAEAGMTVIGITGQTGGRMKDKCDVLINVPSADTP